MCLFGYATHGRIPYAKDLHREKSQFEVAKKIIRKVKQKPTQEEYISKLNKKFKKKCVDMYIEEHGSIIAISQPKKFSYSEINIVAELIVKNLKQFYGYGK